MRTERHILIVEDETDLADLLTLNLQRAGFETQVAGDGAAALERIRAEPPSLVILDIMLPKLSGLDVAQEIRRDPRHARTPILMLTAKATEADQLAGLRLGADDYLPKPFSMKLLLARVEALLRRTAAPPPDEGRNIAFGPIAADLGTNAVRVAGRSVATTLTEFRILVSLIRGRGKTLSRHDLMDRVMGPGIMVTARTIDVHVAALRRKLGDNGRWILTVRGVGYRLGDPSEDIAGPTTGFDSQAESPLRPTSLDDA